MFWFFIFLFFIFLKCVADSNINNYLLASDVQPKPVKFPVLMSSIVAQLHTCIALARVRREVAQLEIDTREVFDACRPEW